MQIETRYFGCVSADAGLAIEFPFGLPAFEDEHSFLAMEHPRTVPLIFLQSMSTPDLCFLALPVLEIDPAYALHISTDELAAIDVREDPPPVTGQDIAALALVAIAEDGRATANLMSPLVVSLRNHRAVQTMRPDGAYSHSQPLESLPGLTREPAQACS